MISVCMATYNGGIFIKQQMDSILDQLSLDDELIISDDGSTDKTLEIIKSYNDTRIKLLLHQKKHKTIKKNNMSFRLICNNFENALREAQGEYIFLSDQDDIWLDNRVSEFIKYFNDYDILMCNFSIIDYQGKLLLNKYYRKSPISRNLIINIIRSRFLGCCLGFKRNILECVLPFPEKFVAHDFWIGCLGALIGNFYFINRPLHAYRRHNGNVSTSTNKSKNNVLIKLAYRLMILIQIIIRCYNMKSWKSIKSIKLEQKGRF